MAKVSCGGKGKTLYITLSVYPCGKADPRKLLTISCPDKNTRFKIATTDKGLGKFKNYILQFYSEHILNQNKKDNKEKG
jgi:hypothetical protein